MVRLRHSIGNAFAYIMETCNSLNQKREDDPPLWHATNCRHMINPESEHIKTFMWVYTTSLGYGCCCASSFSTYKLSEIIPTVMPKLPLAYCNIRTEVNSRARGCGRFAPCSFVCHFWGRRNICLRYHDKLLFLVTWFSTCYTLSKADECSFLRNPSYMWDQLLALDRILTIQRGYLQRS